MPVISIIVVTYNASSLIKDTFASIEAVLGALGSECRSLVEIVVVDGQSVDRTLEIARSFGIIDRLICEPDRGIYDAMNKGARNSSGEWLHFLNSGDIVTDPEQYVALLRTLQSLDDSSEAWAIAGAVHLGSGSHQRRPISNMPHRWLQHAAGLQPHCHQACWFRRSVFLALGGYGEDFGTAADYASIIQFGAARPPFEHGAQVIGYLGGGVSDDTQWKIQMLLHEVRSRMFKLEGLGYRGSWMLSIAVAWYNASRIGIGRLRRAARTKSLEPQTLAGREL